ncbi:MULTISPECIES: hypothetical protein [Cellulomonas]|uniref:hypothetical protein n=1 Tax=Cellulomonas TaxID=1707 RepID=UPI000A4F984B|nr:MULTISPECIES: hypothetical protein [Cellulomonas]MBO9567334.1 hypothetical protein [Cellulomonas iranensis]UCN16108.1 hypothetical protein LFM56_07350 [Cellulomonas iranensis]
MADETDPRVDVTDADILAAKRAWLSACDRGLDPARTARLHDSYRWLVSAQAQQIAEQFRQTHRRRRDGGDGPSASADADEDVRPTRGSDPRAG